MKKIFTLLAVAVAMLGNKTASAQSFGVTSDTVTYTVTGTALTNVHNDITSVVDSVILHWNVVYSNFPSDWVAASGVCDNFLCYNLSALWPSGTVETSDKYRTTGSHDFHLQFNQGLITTTGCYYVTCKLVNRTAPDSVYSTFKVCKSAVGVDDVKLAVSGVKVYPSPAADNAGLAFSLAKTAQVTIAVYDAAGRVVYSNNLGNLTAGVHTLEVPVAHLAPGLYNMHVKANGAGVTERFSVVH